MAEITAAMVMNLRKTSGQGMMDCKNALNEADGDIKKAMEILRKKGLATLAKRAGRETSEGLVVSYISDNAKEATLASLCCETDFVAKSDDFKAAANKMLEYAKACSADDSAEALAETEIKGKKLSELITDTIAKIGEKIEVGNYAKYKITGPGLIVVYIHFNKKTGTMIKVQTNNDNVAASDLVKTAASDIAMHITATKPLALDSSGISAEIIESERKIYTAQMTGKPANIIEKIVDGKMKKFFAENCLLDQAFVKDDSKTVGQIIAEAGKKAGGEAKITAFVQFSVGQ